MPEVCNYCSMKILNSEATIGEKHFHHECFVCSSCKKSLTNTPFRMRENVLYCDKCFKNVTAVKCAECRCPIRGKNRIEAMGQFYHPRHLVCFNCKSHLVKPLFIKKLVEVNGERINCGFCINCADAMDHTVCRKCEKPLDNCLAFDGQSYIHLDCDKSGHGLNDPEVCPPSPVTSSSDSETSSDSLTVPTKQPGRNVIRPLSPTGGLFISPGMAASAYYSGALPGSPVKRYPQRPEPRVPGEVVSSEALHHMHNFTSVGAVPDRAAQIANYKSTVYRPDDVMDGFESAGNVKERADVLSAQMRGSETIGDSDSDDELTILKRQEKAERLNEGFTSTGNVQDRAAHFGKGAQAGSGGTEEAEAEAEERRKQEREERVNAGFASGGSVRDRASMFGKASQRDADGDGEQAAQAAQAEREKSRVYEGFTSGGSIRDRMAMFSQKQEAEKEKEQANDPEVASSSDSEE